MLPVNTGGHAAYQHFGAANLRKFYPNPDSRSSSIWDIIEPFWNLELSYTDDLLRHKYSVFGSRPRTPSCMQRSYLLSIDFKVDSLTDWAAQLKINPSSLSIAGDGTSVITSARERKHRVCDCASKGISDCCCDQYFSQPDQ